MAHNPNINLLEQFCPCGCNVNNAYTSVSSTTSNQCPRTDMEWNNWWKCHNSWEEPFLSRISMSPVWTAVEQAKLFESLNQRVERILVRRMLPHFKKNVPRLVVGSLEPRLWTTWVRFISNGAPSTEVKQRNLKVISHLPKKQNVCYTRVVWRLFMPKLSHLRPQWYRKKWVNAEDGVIYRACITTLSFGYNPLTETITASVEYKSEFFDEEENKWCPI